MTLLDRAADSSWTRSVERRWARVLASSRAHLPWLDGERIAAAIMLVLAIYFLIVSVGYGLNDAAQAAPGTFPALTAGAIIVLSAVWLFSGRPPRGGTAEVPGEQVLGDVHEHPAADAETEAAAPDGSGSLESEAHPIRLVFVVLWSAICLPFVEVIGMIPALWVYLVVLFVVVAHLKWWKVAIITALVLLLASFGAYAGGIYLPDPLDIGPFLYGTVAGILGW